jgi:hypothetical protein
VAVKQWTFSVSSSKAGVGQGEEVLDLSVKVLRIFLYGQTGEISIVKSRLSILERDKL